MEGIRATGSASGKIVKFSGQQLHNLADIAIDLGKRATNELSKNETANSISENKYFIISKNVGSGVIGLAGGVYKGLEHVSPIHFNFIGVYPSYRGYKGAYGECPRA